ncbi:MULTISPECIES: YaaA family protein [Butyricimonas]|uniref:YaaA family protein n=1 Tax=Butyricimonas TaxID=574697 RepID=UPI0007FB2308|nr:MULTISPECIES: YaaA family protein [Butyricimonas]
MLIILSPAKTMDMSMVEKEIPGTTPEYATEAEYLAERMRRFSASDLEKMLKISDKLARENYERYQRFGSLSNPRKQALLAYNGSVFKAIDPASFSVDDFKYAQEHLRVISTLYGLVRPLDLIQAYRIAFAVKLNGVDGGDLYDYWVPKLTAPLLDSVHSAGGILVNLASLDIQGALQMKVIREKVRVITPEFQEWRDGKYETIRTYAKVARGIMTRYILLNRVEDPEELKSFRWDGFTFNPELSDEEHYFFTRVKK